MNLKLNFPTKVIFGPDTIDQLGDIISELGAKRPLIAVGKSSMKKTGTLDKISGMLSGLDVYIHDNISVNLPIQDADSIINSIKNHHADCVIGVGGGSVIDGAKAAAWIAPCGKNIRDFLDGERSPKGLPFIAVPTTSGTGSEVTPFIILMDPEKKQKLSLGAPQAFADYAIVDPKLTFSLDQYQTASTGLDALSHGLESYWSKFSNPFCDALALESISLVLENIEDAFHNPKDINARTQMSYAAMIAGIALSQTATAALHGLTYPLTARHGTPHGIACAFLMREVLSINFYHLSPNKQKHLLYHMKSNTISAAIDLLSYIYSELEVPDKLKHLNIDPGEIEVLAKEATVKNIEKNIIYLSKEKITEIWNKKI